LYFALLASVSISFCIFSSDERPLVATRNYSATVLVAVAHFTRGFLLSNVSQCASAVGRAAAVAGFSRGLSAREAGSSTLHFCLFVCLAGHHAIGGMRRTVMPLCAMLGTISAELAQIRKSRWSGCIAGNRTFRLQAYVRASYDCFDSSPSRIHDMEKVKLSRYQAMEVRDVKDPTLSRQLAQRWR
jgi:hypothetical protein